MLSKRITAFLIVATLALTISGQDKPASELRGVWLTNVDSDILYNSNKLKEGMQFLADHHFNVVYPVVWNKAHTLYPSKLMEDMFGEHIDPQCVGRDPLQEVIDEAAKYDIKVIPWFEFGFSASYKLNGGYLLKMKPHWAARDNQGNLLSKNGFEWMNPYHPEVQQFMIDLVCEVVQNYAVDGIQGDDRLPANPVEGGYSSYTDSLYRAAHSGNAPPQDFRDSSWVRWRADLLNAFGKKLHDSAKQINPSLIVSWAPSIFPWALEEYLQDWPAWIRGGYADEVIPQCYRYDFDRYKILIDELAQMKQDPAYSATPIYAGILAKVGDYLITPDYLLDAIRYNRSKGINGEVLFFYEGLRKDDNMLARTLIESVYREPANFPGD